MEHPYQTPEDFYGIEDNDKEEREQKQAEIIQEIEELIEETFRKGGDIQNWNVNLHYNEGEYKDFFIEKFSELMEWGWNSVTKEWDFNIYYEEAILANCDKNLEIHSMLCETASEIKGLNSIINKKSKELEKYPSEWQGIRKNILDSIQKLKEEVKKLRSKYCKLSEQLIRYTA